MASLLDIITPVLKRVRARDVKMETGAEENEVTAIIYEKEYRFHLNGEDRIIYSRGDRLGSFLIEEIDALDHITMPYITIPSSSSLSPLSSSSQKLPEQRASDVALRLHLIIEGDVYLSREIVPYLGAGTQQSVNYYVSRA